MLKATYKNILVFSAIFNHKSK